MSERKFRAQILLEPAQRRRLEEIARREGRSISEISRRVIDLGLQVLEGEREVWERRAIVLERLKAFRARQPRVYDGDLVNEARQEREEETSRLWGGG